MSSCVQVKQFPLEEEYKKETGISPDDIKKLREWLITQPHLPGEHITDLDLILAYHSCGRSTAVTKQVLDAHFTLKTIFTDLFKDRTLDAKIKSAATTTLMMPLHSRTKEGYAIFYSHFLNVNPQNFHMADTYKALLMIWELWSFEEGTWPGFIIAADFAGMHFGHLARFESTSFQQFTYFLQDATLVNLKGIHVYNAPSVIDKALILTKPFLSKSITELLHVHTGGLNDLGEFFPIDGFPKEAGGKYKSLEECKEEVIAKLRAGEEFFAAESKKRVVEARRPGKPKTISDFFGGMEGSFKQLNIG